MRVTSPSHSCHAASAVTAVRMGSYLRKTRECTAMGAINAVSPRTRAMFAMFEP